MTTSQRMRSWCYKIVHVLLFLTPVVAVKSVVVPFVDLIWCCCCCCCCALVQRVWLRIELLEILRARSRLLSRGVTCVCITWLFCLCCCRLLNEAGLERLCTELLLTLRSGESNCNLSATVSSVCVLFRFSGFGWALSDDEDESSSVENVTTT